MKKLITLNGGPALKTESVDIRKKDDIAAGLIFWKVISEMFPGITWGEIYGVKGNGLSGFTSFMNKVGKGISSFTTKTGKVVGSVVDKTGEKIGQAIRLVSDEKVQNTISRGAQAYATGGASEAARVVAAEFANSGNPVSEAGKEAKIQYSAFPNSFGIDPKILAIAGGAVLFIFIVSTIPRRK